MAIEHLPGDHLHLVCDTEGCSTGITHDGTEEELLAFAEESGWHIEFGLHFCPLATMHECSVCGAGTAAGIKDVATGEWTYYCAEHWPY
jgi:hypothetical protein